MRTAHRSRFRPILGFSSSLVFLLIIAVTASSEDASTSSSVAPMESSSSASTTEAMTSVSVSEDTAIASTTELSELTTTATELPPCNGFKSFTKKSSFTKCSGSDIFLPYENNAFHTADFSDFTQQEFEQMLCVKDEGGGATDDIRKFKGNLLISGSKITKISKISLAYASNKFQSFILKNNLFLEHVKLETKSQQTNFIKLVISGNKKLSNESLNHLKNLTFKLDSSYIQDFGECDFDNAALSAASQLEGCHYIRGDLVLNGDTEIDALQVESLKNVTGCIKIENSKVTNLDLIKTIVKSDCTQKHVIRGNQKLCLHPEDLNKTRKHFEAMGTGQNLIYENNMQGNGCKGKCSSNYIKESNDKTCIIITDDLLIENIDEKMDMSYLHQVEEIQGSLRITGTSLKNVTLFPNLKTIVFDKLDKGSAIYIQRNKEMTYFDLPKLTSVVLHKSRKINDAFLMEGNGNYTMDEDLAERFINLTQTDKSNLPIVDLSGGNGNATFNVTISGRSSRRKNDTEALDDDEEAASMSTGAYVGIGVGICVAVLAGIAIGVLVAVLVRRRQRKKRDERQKKLDEEVERVKIVVNDASSSSNNTTQNEDKCDTIMDFPSEIDEEDKTGCKGIRLPGHRPSFGLVGHFSTLEPQFKTQQRFNSDVTQVLVAKDGVMKIKIKRKNLNFEEASKLELETMDPKKKKIWTHNPRFSLYGIEPRKEINEEIWYDHGDGPFDPHAFIENCMKSSAVSLKYRTIMAALDYVMRHKRFGNPHDPTAPPKQLIEVTGPIHIIGDTHGALIDLQMIFSLDPEKVVEKHNIHPMLYYRYLFTGDYLDRGLYDTTLFAFLTVFATLYPSRVFLLRGNHEWIDELHNSSCTAHCRQNWPLENAIAVRNKIKEVSCWLPIAARVNGRALAVHGGIGHFWKNASEGDDLQKRFDTLPMPMCMVNGVLEDYLTENCFQGWPADKVEEAIIAIENLLWNDPQYVSMPASLRGAGAYFNHDDVDEFTKRFDLDVIIRAHQDIGFYHAFGGKLISLFGSFDNKTSTFGLPYFFSVKDYMEYISDMSETPSTAVLRIDSNNMLHYMLMRHIYSKEDCTPADENKRKRITKFTEQKPDEEWKKKLDKRNEDGNRNNTKFFGKGSINKETPKQSGEKSGVMSGTQSVQSIQSGMGSNEGQVGQAQKKGKPSTADGSKKGKSKKNAAKTKETNKTKKGS